MADNDAIFEKIMESVGNDGPFQKRYNYIFNVAGVLCFAMAYMNIILALNEPEHSCHVPGREKYNISNLELWRNITLPKETNNKGEDSRSFCRMYNVTGHLLDEHYEAWSFEDADVVSCTHGYDYDRKYYDRTPVTENDWVCDKELYVTNALVITRVAEVIGTFILGQLGDTMGRLPVYYISVFAITFGRLLSMFTASVYVLFAMAVFIGCFAANSSFQSPMIIAMEISKSENRTAVAMHQFVAWTIGVSIVPLILWWLKDWFWFMLVTSLPCIIFAFFPKYCIESPQWLISQGRYKKCAEELEKIAAVNGKKDFVMSEAKLKAMMVHNKTETAYGMASIFSNWQMAKNAILLVLCCVIGGLPVHTLVFLSTRMDGNPFMNFFFQSLVEMPAYLIGQVLCDRIGRRFTNAVSLFGAAMSCIPIYFIIKDTEYEIYTTVFAVILKFWSCVTFLAVTLQGVEIYPTCLRQSGASLGVILSQTFGVLGPYIVLLGTNVDVRYPFIIMGVTTFFGAIMSLYIPETLHQQLPQTMEDAKEFGKNQSFWSIPKKPGNYEAVRKDDIELS